MEHERYIIQLNIKSKVSKRPGNKPWRCRAWCAECGDEITDLETFNYYEGWAKIQARCKALKVCHKCGAPLVLEEKREVLSE